jgi:hypothetical protein
MKTAIPSAGLLLALGILPVSAKPSKPPVAIYLQSEPESKTFTGTIIKNGDNFVLSDSASKLSYILDDRGKAGPYEGKKVRVTGTIDSATNTIHVEAIQEIT